MIKILLLITCGITVFLIFFSIISVIKGSKNNKKNRNLNLKFKEMTFLKKRIFMAVIIFFITVIILQNTIFALIAFILYIYFDWHIQNNKSKQMAVLIDKQVIEALTIIKNSVQSGQSLAQAMGTTGEELKEPIKSEFIKMSESLSLGASFDKVLINASENAPSREFKLMIDTIRISKDSGASLTGIFDRIILATSQRSAMRAKVDALTAQGRMSGNIVSVIPFFVILMMYTIEPDMMRSLFTTLAGNMLLFIVVIMVLTGSFVIRKLTEIDF
ncbi:MAG: type II secretion system F family protein [Endomicrobium sp.]|jgi:tight adherence protein B|nr:type II secretion system F family protein [Endomicrobium sp.]